MTTTTNELQAWSEHARKNRETIARLEADLRNRVVAVEQDSACELVVTLQPGLDRSRIVGLMHAFNSYPGVIEVTAR